VASPLLSNVYLHYVFDLWDERWRRREAVAVDDACPESGRKASAGTVMLAGLPILVGLQMILGFFRL
jgi:hypothetical protein